MIKRFLNLRILGKKVQPKNLRFQYQRNIFSLSQNRLAFNFSNTNIPEDLESFNQERLKRSEVLRIRNEAKQILEEEKKEREELEKRGQLSPQEIMKNVNKKK